MPTPFFFPQHHHDALKFSLALSNSLLPQKLLRSFFRRFFIRDEDSRTATTGGGEWRLRKPREIEGRGRVSERRIWIWEIWRVEDIYGEASDACCFSLGTRSQGQRSDNEIAWPGLVLVLLRFIKSKGWSLFNSCGFFFFLCWCCHVAQILKCHWWIHGMVNRITLVYYYMLWYLKNRTLCFVAEISKFFFLEFCH